MKVIIGCEESQTICKAFRSLGVEAYSCDLKPCSGGHPEWHFKMSLFDAIKGGMLVTQSGSLVFIDKWTLGIFHPPCTHLCVSGSRHFAQKIKDGRQSEGIKLFLDMAAIDIPHTCLENPVGIMSSIYGKPTQIIQPYFFGDKKQKTTCLWLKSLPPLWHCKEPDMFNSETTHTDRGKMITLRSGKVMAAWSAKLSPSSDRGEIRSVTFNGIAQAMATQWTDHLLNKYKNLQ